MIAAGRRLLVSLFALAVSTPAWAGVLPPGAEVPSGRSVDLAAFARLVAARYDVRFRHVVAADVDRDGDQDVIGAGERGLVVWLNDGAGHLTSQAPRSRDAIDPIAPRSAWRERATTTLDIAPNGAPSTSVPAAERLTLSLARHGFARDRRAAPARDRSSLRIPRAPPTAAL